MIRMNFSALRVSFNADFPQVSFERGCFNSSKAGFSVTNWNAQERLAKRWPEEYEVEATVSRLRATAIKQLNSLLTVGQRDKTREAMAR